MLFIIGNFSLNISVVLSIVIENLFIKLKWIIKTIYINKKIIFSY